MRRTSRLRPSCSTTLKAVEQAESPRCVAPPDLNKVLAFAQDNERKFMQGVARGLELAAKDRGLAYRIAQAGNDAGKMIEQVEAFRDARTGALVAAPVDARLRLTLRVLARAAEHQFRRVWRNVKRVQATTRRRARGEARL